MQINLFFSNYYKSLGREQRRASRCTRHVYRLDLLLRQRENAKCIQAWPLWNYRIVITIFLIYRIVYRSKTVFDIS